MRTVLSSEAPHNSEPTQFSTLCLPSQEELYRIDTIGPRAMAGFVVGILAVIFIFGVVDFVQCIV